MLQGPPIRPDRMPLPFKEQRRRIGGEARELLAVEGNAEPGAVGDGKMTVGIEDEGLGQDAVNVGAAADELDEVGRREG